MSDEFIFNDNSEDVVLGGLVGKVRNVEIYMQGTTSIFNDANLLITRFDQFGNFTNTGNTSTAGVVSGASGVFAANMSSASVATGAIGCATVTATTSVSAPLGIFASLSAPFKMFDIKHPQKPGMRLRHGSLEGPELAVYARGKTIDSIVSLPEYWQHLIDVNTITVQLTPMHPEQTLIVESVDELQIHVAGNKHLPYYYMVMAERKDVPKLDVETTQTHDYGF